MTPLLGTKNSSAPVGDKSGGDRRAARSLLSCALWRGMGRLWRGMGGMGRPEPLAAHHPRQQQGLSGFHETRDTNHGFFVSLFTIVHHCSALFSKKYCPAPVPSCRPVTAFLRVVARHGRLWRGMGGMGCPEPLFAHHPHQQHDHLGFHATRDPAIARRAASASANSEVFTRHESRNTNHGLYAFFPTISHDFPAFPAILRPPLPPETVSEPRQPFSVGFTTSAVSSSPRLPPGCCR